MFQNPFILFWMLVLFIALQVTKITAQSCFIYMSSWSGNSVIYHINNNLQTPFATQEEYETAIVNAVSSWNDAGANFEFIRGDNVNYEQNQEPEGIYQVGYYVEPSDERIAYTNVIPDPPSYITKVETYFNQYFQFSSNPSSTQYDIQSVILHEFGHWISLGNEYDYFCSDNVMYYGLDPAQIKQELTQDDKNGIIFIYGENPATQLEINLVLNRQHSFFEYKPETLLYFQKRMVNDKAKKRSSNLIDCPCLKNILKIKKFNLEGIK
jgi:hypothetical protein